MAIPAKGSIYRSGDAKKLADKMEAERQAERSRFSVQGGQFGGSGLYVSPYGNYLDPALEAQVARSRGNNVRPSPATVNMAPVAKPVAPRSPGRGLTYAEAYGPGSTVVADRVAEEKRIAKERAAMQKAIGKIGAAKGRYAYPAPQASATSSDRPAYTPKSPQRVPATDDSSGYSASPTAAAGRAALGYVESAIPGGFNPRSPGKPATASGVADYIRGAIPGGFSPQTPPPPADNRPFVTSKGGQKIYYTREQAARPGRSSAASASARPLPASNYSPLPMPVSQPFSPQSLPVDPNVYNQMVATGGGQAGGGASAAYPQPQAQPIPYGGVYNPQMALPRGGIPAAPITAQQGLPFSGVYNPQAALPSGGVPPTPDLGPDFPSQIPIVQPRQPLRRGGATLGDVANEYIVSAPQSIATGVGATIQDLKQLLAQNKISRERYRELEYQLYQQAAMDRANPQ